MSEEKKILRRKMISIRDSIDPEKRKTADGKIRKSFLECFRERFQPETETKDCLILLYASTRSEVDTFGIWKELMGSQIRFAFPKVLGKRHMEFFITESQADLKEAFQGILEPVTTEVVTEEMIRNSYCILVMPGVAFDEAGNRMGYGGGFYDTYLERFEKDIDLKAALAFEAQICKEGLVTEEHDRKPDLIITENRVIEVV
ncbi:MAG: 5-formyltetrahydrofolate cyclo-ligase [Lachnospiraceae bacterium]|nr:5-formyltetrahydrofolate cyclo-ligase [Lachnospiraceae bacterium]